MDFLSALYNGDAVLKRTGLLPESSSIEPTISIRVQSTHDRKRSIRANIFYPPGAKPGAGPKLPVHLHVHGGGFVYELFPFDGEIAAFIAAKANCIVIDTDYVKAPAHPFPAAYNDVSDVVSYIYAHPDDWDVSRFTISGASAGGNLALAVAAHQPKGALKAVIAWYPWLDLTPNPATNVVQAIPKGNPGSPLPEWILLRFTEAYLPDGVNLKDTRVSPYYAEPDVFPPITIITGTCDPLLQNINRFIARLREAGNDVDAMIVEGVGHIWDRTVKKGDAKYLKIREEAYELQVSRIQKAWST